MKKFNSKPYGSHVDRMNYGGAKFCRFALFPLMLLMLLLLPAGMVAQKAASSSKYIATYESSTQTLTFEKYEGETLPENSVVVEDKMTVEDMNEKLGNGTIVHIVFDKSFSTYTPTSLYRFFANLTKLKTITGLECLNTEKVTNMCNMFASCSSLTSLDVTHFNTAKVTNMSYMFFSCSSLTSLDVTHFNTANVTNMNRMFEYCSSLTSLDVTHFNTAKVTYMGRMFDDCSSLSSLDVTHFNTANVTDMRYMFSSCSSLTSLDVTHFNTANVTNMSYMFSSCSSLTSLDVTHFNTANVTDMSKMFSSCSSLTSLDVTHFNTEKVTNMSFIFSDCSSLTSLDVTHFNTEKVSGMNGMFYSCPKLTSLDVRNFNTANVTNMSYMFSGCSALTTIYASDKFVTTKVSSGFDMFTGCEKLKGYNDSKTDHTYAYCGTDGYFTPVFDYAEFDNATGTLTFRRSLSKPAGAYDLNVESNDPGWNAQSANIKKVVFDASFANARPTSCCKWFDGCQKLTEIKGIENLNTQNVTDMSSMFSDCQKLTSLDLSNFNTANVKYMRSMFGFCQELTSLNVTNFNTANVEDMRSMFKNCSALTGIFASNKFVTDRVIDGSDMFSGCDKLIGAIKYIGSQTDHHYANYENGYFSPEGGFPAYAVFDGGTRTLTFGRGLSKPAGAYDLNEGNNEPGWLTQKENIYKVVFDASFANARPTSCYKWFDGCANLTNIEGIENLNTEKVTNMGSMFSGCYVLTSLDVSNFNTQNVEDMSYMFNRCIKLTSLDVSNFNTQKVEKMNFMFSCCEGLNSLDLSKFDTQNVTNMSYMFWRSSALTTIYASDKFVTTKVSSGAKMFQGCTNLKGFIDYISNSDKDNYEYANYKTGYFTKLVGKNGEKKIGAAGETLATENLVLDDGKDFVAYEPFVAKNAFYIRVIPEGSTWGTLCLPFAIDQSQETGCKFYRLTGIDNDNECITLESYEGAEIPAGTPVLFKMNENEPTLSISVQNVGIVTKPKAGTNTDVNLVGSFTKIGGKDNKGLDKNDYIIGKNKFWRVSDLNDGNGVGIKPMRAYIHPANEYQARAAMLSIGKGDGTTAIDNLNAISNDANAEYYDANGRRTNGLQKGLNIVKRGSKTYKIMVK